MDQGGQILGLGFIAVPDGHGNLVYPEALGLRRAQVEPVLQALAPLGSCRRRDLDVTGRASGDQHALDARHDRQVLATSHERQRPRGRWNRWVHGPTVAQAAAVRRDAADERRVR